MSSATAPARPSLTPALAVLVTGLILSMVGWYQVRDYERQSLQFRFDQRTTDIAESVAQLFSSYSHLLHSVRGFFLASQAVTQTEWQSFIAELELAESYPAVTALIYSPYVTRTQRAAFLERMGPAYRITPPGDREHYVPITYIYAPVDGPLQGADQLAEDVRREALWQARDSGRSTLTRHLVLRRDQELEAPPVAALLVLPVYRNAAPLTTVEQRRAALTGYVHLAFRIEELVQPIFANLRNDMRLQIYEDGPGDTSVRIYDSGVIGKAPAADALRRELSIDVSDRRWTMQLTMLPAFRAGTPGRAPLVLAGGLVITALMFLLVLALRRSEARAQLLATQMTEELRSVEDRHGKIVENSADGILTLDDKGQVQTFNRAAGRIFGYAAREVIGRNVEFLLPGPFETAVKEALAQFRKQDERALAGFRREVEGRRRTGENFPVQAALNVMNSGGRVQVVALISDISERKVTEDRIRHIAHHDALTGLPNRYLLTDRLASAIQSSRSEQRLVGLLMIDLDHFKRINDSLGHQAGDRLLLTVAERLQACVKEGDTVARMGGDEFVVVLPDLAQREDAERVARRVVEQVSKPFMLGQQELLVTPSVGLCVAPDDGDDPRLLLKNADAAMYAAKSQGRANFQKFTADMQLLAQQKLEMESEFRRGLDRGEFVMHYQPLLTVDDVRLIGMEALVRWKHPQRGLVPPDRFIPLAEETGLIVPLGEYVMRRSCEETQQMRVQTGLPLNVAVNASPRQFREKNFLDLLRSALNDSGLPPEALTLEITETVLADRPEETIALLREVRSLGVQVAADDFGTGYSSLSYVTRFPITKLKVDRSFIRDVTDDAADAAVTGAIIAMAHSLQLKVVAEGVETLSQLAFLRAHRCDEAQGYLFGAAMSKDEFLNVAMRPETLRKNLPA